MRPFARALPLGLSLALSAGALRADTFTVTTTADSGAGSLRKAIEDANGHGGADAIAFNIPGGGVHTIAPATPLPALGGSLTINGYTQPGSSANTNGPTQGLNTVLTIEIDCTNGGTYCLKVGGNDVTLKGLVVNRAAAGYCIATDFFQRIQNFVLEGSFIGTTPDGMTALPTISNVIVGNSENARIGGTTPAARNLLAGQSTDFGFQSSNAADSGNVVQGNLFCTNKTGLLPMGGQQLGGVILIGGGGGGNTSNVTIGGLTPGAGNVFGCLSYGMRLSSMDDVTVQGNKIGVDPSGTKAISGGMGPGILIENGTNILIGGTAAGAANVIGAKIVGISGGSGTIQGNFIGTDATATLDLGNDRAGLSLSGTNVVVGGVGSGEANVILHNRGGGVSVTSGTGIAIRGNRIFDNLGAPFTLPATGIDLTCGISGCNGPAGPNPNDPLDVDGSPGGNDLLNFPLVASAVPEGSGTRVIGTYDSAASSTFTLDFYANPACRARPRAHLQADQYLGATNVTTNGSGHAAFNVLLPAAITAGQPVVATATDANGSTSELTAEIVFSVTPDFASATSNPIVQIKGTLFSGTPTVTVGGVPATGVTLNSDSQLTATFPTRPAGTLNDVVVSVAGGPTGRLRNGYVALPSDVSGGFTYAAPIAKLMASGITLGCGAGIYCPASSITRAEMAIFLIRAKFGLCFTPPPATGTKFLDVPANAFGAKHIELLASLGVTSGCGNGNFCPNSTVTRDQMAVFLLRTLLGSSFAPPAPTGMFQDVPVSHPFAKWIEELARRNITGGCGGSNYCPGNANTRGEMAAFITRTFGLP